ncbi:dienelactone hydrolase family protein, partial [Streptomyces broussonetiae]
MTELQRTDLDIQTEDGVADAYLVHPTDGRPRPGVLF